MSKRFAGEVKAKGRPRTAVAIELGQHMLVIRGRNHHENVSEIFRSRSDERWPSNVDLFDERLKRQVGGTGRLHEGIQVHHDELQQPTLIADIESARAALLGALELSELA